MLFCAILWKLFAKMPENILHFLQSFALSWSQEFQLFWGNFEEKQSPAKDIKLIFFFVMVTPKIWQKKYQNLVRTFFFDFHSNFLHKLHQIMGKTLFFIFI